ncbi:hypothetical protein [Streptosporangium sp. NBC_01756]|uniref:hypothetical protein n=1 Tax=Streptosporangium sp. NBC_01756 TaxID=2975950 RepID=UPI002DD8836E|nr:hypothetical protein [Streptosporangium sp. NBC_01756]WSC89465.1 hypothetical protein OIE48_15165 [Streptosporangium sp. NBC_01756]
MLLFRAGLDDADKWASIIGMSVTVISFLLSVYGIVLARRAAVSNALPTAVQPSDVVQVIASGSRSIAAHTLSGLASTDGNPADEDEKRPAVPAPTEHADHRPEEVLTEPPPSTKARIQATGERSIAAHTISGTVSTGDTPPSTPTAG